ncbi:uncharacterized protein LOC135167534 [Diachasmimorpha longicaudata]|uniref:uncharacterized protein LOC135167534 n=1 Tax=Diachasmimorpha longicaudata TaxID=58733 RepID=UPI0030B89700
MSVNSAFTLRSNFQFHVTKNFWPNFIALNHVIGSPSATSSRLQYLTRVLERVEHHSTLNSSEVNYFVPNTMVVNNKISYNVIVFAAAIAAAGGYHTIVTRNRDTPLDMGQFIIKRFVEDTDETPEGSHIFMKVDSPFPEDAHLPNMFRLNNRQYSPMEQHVFTEYYNQPAGDELIEDGDEIDGSQFPPEARSFHQHEGDQSVGNGFLTNECDIYDIIPLQKRVPFLSERIPTDEVPAGNRPSPKITKVSGPLASDVKIVLRNMNVPIDEGSSGRKIIAVKPVNDDIYLVEEENSESPEDSSRRGLGKKLALVKFPLLKIEKNPPPQPTDSQPTEEPILVVKEHDQPTNNNHSPAGSQKDTDQPMLEEKQSIEHAFIPLNESIFPNDGDCQPGTRFPYYCNNCTCNSSGKGASCTKKLCVTGSFNRDGSLKIKPEPSQAYAFLKYVESHGNRTSSNSSKEPQAVIGHGRFTKEIIDADGSKRKESTLLGYLITNESSGSPKQPDSHSQEIGNDVPTTKNTINFANECKADPYLIVKPMKPTKILEYPNLSIIGKLESTGNLIPPENYNNHNYERVGTFYRP